MSLAYPVDRLDWALFNVQCWNIKSGLYIALQPPCVFDHSCGAGWGREPPSSPPRPALLRLLLALTLWVCDNDLTLAMQTINHINSCGFVTIHLTLSRTPKFSQKKSNSTKPCLLLDYVPNSHWARHFSTREGFWNIFFKADVSLSLSFIGREKKA